MASNPLLEIYNISYSNCLSVLPESTYDYLANDKEDRESFFIYVGETFGVDENTKTQINGTVRQTIHVYSSKEERSLLGETMGKIVSLTRINRKTKSFDLAIRSLDSRIIPDPATIPYGLHGVIEIEYYFS